MYSEKLTINEVYQNFSRVLREYREKTGRLRREFYEVFGMNEDRVETILQNDKKPHAIKKSEMRMAEKEFTLSEKYRIFGIEKLDVAEARKIFWNLPLEKRLEISHNSRSNENYIKEVKNYILTKRLNQFYLIAKQ